MQAALALIPLILQLLPQITVGVQELIAWIDSIRLAASQTSEWTPALEAQYRAALFAKTGDAAYAPDAK